MKVLNFYGGAGIGKSTIAADIFSKLKRKGNKTELVGDNVEYLLHRNDEFISIDGRKETNLERAKVKDEEIKAVLGWSGHWIHGNIALGDGQGAVGLEDAVIVDVVMGDYKWLIYLKSN